MSFSLNFFRVFLIYIYIFFFGETTFGILLFVHSFIETENKKKIKNNMKFIRSSTHGVAVRQKSFLTLLEIRNP